MPLFLETDSEDEYTELEEFTIKLESDAENDDRKTDRKIEGLKNNRKRKLDSDVADGDGDGDGVSNVYDDDLNPGSDSDSDFEDVNFLAVPIGKKKEKNNQLKSKLSLRYLSLLTYTSFLYKRHSELINPKILKKLNKLIPKKIRKLLNSFDDVSLIYCLKYMLKWFRLNFKVVGNGLRVIGLNDEKVYSKSFTNSSFPKFDLNQSVKSFSGNRDTAAQIFNSLLKSLDFETRLVFSLPLPENIPQPTTQPKPQDIDLLYPYFWTELINPLNSLEIIILESICFHNEEDRLIRINMDEYTDKFYPIQSKFNQLSMHWVLAIDRGIIDVSPRYMPDIAYRYFETLDLRTHSGRETLLMNTVINLLKGAENSLELDGLKKLALSNCRIPKNYTALKRNPNFITSNTLRHNEAIRGDFISKVTLEGKKVNVYLKSNVIVGKSERRWKYLGRSINKNQLNHPIKVISDITARTVLNKRIAIFNKIYQPELNEIGLYSYSQTVPYTNSILIVDGREILPSNKWGNIEIFHQCMIPKGTKWLKLTNIISIAKSYHRDPSNEPFAYVPVLVGFEFMVKTRHAVPRLDGILIFDQDSNLVKKVWFRAQSLLLKRKIDAKRNQSLLGWKKMIQLLRMKANLDSNYGAIESD